MNSDLRTGVACIIAATVIFAVALTCFCIALGLDFQNEGWRYDGGFDVQNGDAIWGQPMIFASTFGFVLSIVLFFIGVQRVSRNP